MQYRNLLLIRIMALSAMQPKFCIAEVRALNTDAAKVTAVTIPDEKKL